MTMDIHKIILDEWRESVADVVAGRDPLDGHDGLANYIARFPDKPVTTYWGNVAFTAERCEVSGCHDAVYTSGKCQFHYKAEMNHRARWGS